MATFNKTAGINGTANFNFFQLLLGLIIWFAKPQHRISFHRFIINTMFATAVKPLTPFDVLIITTFNTLVTIAPFKVTK